MAADPRTRRAASGARGIALLEVLIGLLIFLVGVLGLVGLQAKAIQFTVQSEDRSRAALLANELVSAMWDQQSSTIDDAQLADWQKSVAAALPDGTGTVSTSAGVTTIMLSWKSPRVAKGDSASNRYVTQVVLP
jgi:type IV pilus assembly protein PilV